MKVGMQIVFQNHEGVRDADMFRKETQLAIEAEAMGFDFVGLVEHHFTDYAMCPDNAQVLSYIAGKTSKIKLMPAAFILPWNDPLRVVEKAVLLDILSEGRVIVGMGRGVARCEFEGLRVEMGESRDRFDQAAEIILNGLKTGFVEGDTEHYKQPRVEIRPRAERDFADRVYMVGMSPSSVEVAARLGLGCLKFSQGLWVNAMPEVNAYREKFQQIQGRKAPPILIADMIACFSDAGKASEFGRKYQSTYYDSVLSHYEFGGSHFKTIPAYSNYAAGADALNKEGGVDKALQEYLQSNLTGTPEQILQTLEERKEIVGDYDLSVNFTYGSMPYEDVWEQAKLFADKVMPHIKG